MIDTEVNLVEEVSFVQNLLFSSLNKKLNTVVTSPKKPTGVLADLATVPMSKIEACFGDFGIQARYLAEHFDFSHPCLQPVLDLFASPNVINKINESLALYEDAKDFDALNVIKLLNRSVNDSHLAKELHRLVSNRVPIRAIANADLREDMRRKGRLARNSGSVSFSEFEVYLRDWMQSPESLKGFVRSDVPDKDLEKCNNILDKFSDLGLDDQRNACLYYMHNVLLKKEPYCGFNKMDIGFIAGMLGKLHGFIPSRSSISLFLYNNFNLTRFLLQHVCLAPKAINEVLKWVDEVWSVNDPSTLFEALECVDLEDDWEGIIKSYFRQYPIFNYRARVYLVSNPIVNKLLPDEILEIIEQLDNFHDYGGLPVFDHFLLMIPSVHINESFYNDKNKGYFINDGKVLRDFERKEDASVFLDFLLMKRGIVIPLIIGQKDDQQYPICYCV